MAVEKARETKEFPKRKTLELLSQQRLSFLLTIFLFLLALFLWLLRSTPEGQRLLFSWQSKRATYLAIQKFQESFQKDPQLGFPIEKLGIKVPLNPSLPVLLVVLGECEGCNEGAAYEWVESLSKWETLRKEIFSVLVVQSGIEKVSKIVKGAKGVELIEDKEGKIAQSLNAFFVPRAYGFVDGKLVRLQKETNAGIVGVLEGFMVAAKGEEKAREILNAWSAEMREKAWGKETASLVKGGEKR